MKRLLIEAAKQKRDGTIRASVVGPVGGEDDFLEKKMHTHSLSHFLKKQRRGVRGFGLGIFYYSSQ